MSFKTTMFRASKVWHFCSSVGDLPSVLQITVFRVFHKKRTALTEPNLHRGRSGVGNRDDARIVTYHLSHHMRALPFHLHNLIWSLDGMSVTISVNHSLFMNICVTSNLDMTNFLCAWNLHWFSETNGVRRSSLKN